MKLGQQITAYIKDHSCCTAEQIMQTMEEQRQAPRYITMVVLRSLVSKDKVAEVPDKFFVGSKKQTEYVTPAIGNCELCGIYSHHLIMGECPACIDKYNHGNEVAAA